MEDKILIEVSKKEMSDLLDYLEPYFDSKEWDWLKVHAVLDGLTSSIKAGCNIQKFEKHIYPDQSN